MSPERPIFIIGAGRSGSSVFHEMFARHPGVAYLSGLCLRFPSRPGLNRLLMTMLEKPVLGTALLPMSKPYECWEFWRLHAREFVETCRDLRADDVRPGVASRLRDVLGEMVTPARSRLLIKITGWPRVGYLRAVFPDALFIHMVRDGRAVASSLLETAFWDGWTGPDRWRFGELCPEYRLEWESHHKSYVVLAGINWKLVIDAIDKAFSELDSSACMEVRYEDFSADPIRQFARVLTFCGLPDLPQFQSSLAAVPLQDRNGKWQSNLTVDQQVLLQRSLQDHLERYRYRPVALGIR